MATVVAVKSTVRPAVCTVRTIASFGDKAAVHLLPVAVQDEQAVVDGQAEAEGGRQVEREDAHVGERRHDAQDGEGAEDLQSADGEGEGCRHDAAEDEQQQDHRRQEGVELGLLEVLLDLGADLVEHLGLAADLHVDGGVGLFVAGGQGLDLLGHLVVGPCQAGQHQGLGAVPAPQRRRADRATSTSWPGSPSDSSAKRAVRARPASATAGLSTVLPPWP